MRRARCEYKPDGIFVLRNKILKCEKSAGRVGAEELFLRAWAVEFLIGG